MKYKRKPYFIDAIQWRGKNHSQVVEFCGLDNCYFSDDQKELFVKANHRFIKLDIGEYISKEDTEALYVYVEDYFEKVYEEVQDDNVWGDKYE